MAAKNPKTGESTSNGQMDLEGFRQSPDDQGLSLDALSGSLANLLGEGSDPYGADVEDDSAEPAQADAAEEAQPTRKGMSIPAVEDANDPCPISPLTILEAMLFVGHPGDEPLSNSQVASLMRGVRPAEIDQYVADLNLNYDEQNCPYRIESVAGGYRMVLRQSQSSLRNVFYGKVRSAKLSQAVIDVLAIVAYHQPIEKAAVDEIRREPSGRLLNQLVRRELVRVERTEDKPRKSLYSTTDRFLDFFGLESLDDLPQSQDFDRR